MSADILRRAAALMRERAGAATQGAWRFETAPNGFSPMVIGGGMAVADTFDKPHLSDAKHIASWHPTVALAVADWLDTAGADIWAHGPLCECGTGCDACDDNLWEPHARAALVVARTYLGLDE